MKFPVFLFAVLVFITSFVGQTASLPAPADDALEARLENQVGTPVLITAVDAAANAGDSTFATKNGGNKKAKNGKKGKKGKGEKGGKKKGGKKGGATDTAGNAA
ncbi:hypothetical protein M378DRAFT_161956 [Amanita muscaria Koide BX008]|uniref:Uncharacterized protein n=1 Tax=Amanita muscaria (strain Koide BX008) TaxID=946122 RepID=A0A0C2TFJ8_AMAMK|nr:hypothetical protein M378DRAFT_161956 [Amanita muscaria Koide BX008]